MPSKTALFKYMFCPNTKYYVMSKQVVTQADKNVERLEEKRESQLSRKEFQINKLSDEELMNELEQKGELEKKREERRSKMEEVKIEKAEREVDKALERLEDVEFGLMLDKNRIKQHLLGPHTAESELKLCICVRKRPIFKDEKEKGEIDVVSCVNPQIVVRKLRCRVDGIIEYVENHAFTFDNTFNENDSNEDVYRYSIYPHIEYIINKGIVTCFAFGKTGSGKTFTMKGVQELGITDLFKMINTKYRHLNIHMFLSFFEIYGGRCYDLLNNHNKLTILEDKNQNVQIQGLSDKEVGTMDEMLQVISYGNSVRTTHQTDTSFICQVILRDPNGKVQGKLLLVDLPGNERANRARRTEGAEISKTLIALKECIRAMDTNKQGSRGNHVPFRGSKLTMALKDSFMSKNNNTRIVMIACISPGSSSADISINTLRYVDRLIDRKIPSDPIKDVKNDPNEFLEEPIEEVKVEPERAPQRAYEQETARIQKSKNEAQTEKMIEEPIKDVQFQTNYI